jgi:hypothetical protein
LSAYDEVGFLSVYAVDTGTAGGCCFTGALLTIGGGGLPEAAAGLDTGQRLALAAAAVAPDLGWILEKSTRIWSDLVTILWISFGRYLRTKPYFVKF